MKILKISIVLFATVLFTSCGSSLESDAQKVADFMCESKDSSQDMSKIGEKMKKAMELEKEMSEKYKSPEDKKKFEDALEKAMESCK